MLRSPNKGRPKSRSRSHDFDCPSARPRTRVEIKKELDKEKFKEKIIEIELKMSTKIEKLETQHQNTVLWFTEEIRKLVSANNTLSEILLKLTKKVEILETKNHENTNPTVKGVFEHKSNPNPSCQNSPIILPETNNESEMECDYDEDNLNRVQHKENDQIRPDNLNFEEDLTLKAEAFEKDFKLPLSGAEVHITSLRGGADVASGYDRVVPDGEGLWLELSEEQIFKHNFRKRQRTATRQYYTMPGVTLHQQLSAEKYPFPRRHKLAVKIQRSGPNSKLKTGKFYIHAYQIKIYNPKEGSRWLGTGRLVQKLKRRFGAAYHPRPNRSQQRVNLQPQQNQNVGQPIKINSQISEQPQIKRMINNRLVNNPEVSYANVARQNQQYPHYLYQPQQASQ